MSHLAMQRLHNQFLAAPHSGNVAEMVAALGAVQGQDYLGTLWSLGVRVRARVRVGARGRDGLSQTEVEAAYAQPADKATFVRSWVLRGTLHFVAAADLGWMLELLAPRLLSSLTRRYRELELDAATLPRCDQLLVATIREEGPLERKILLERLGAAGISTAGQRGIHLLQHASLQGLIYQAAVQHNQAVFELVERLPQGLRFPDRQAALAELARRYFSTHGPATVQDFCWWSGLTAAEARQALGALQAELSSQVVCGITYWDAADASAAELSAPAAPETDLERAYLLAGESRQRAYLLPGFDEYLISYKDRSASIDPEHQKLWMSNTNGMLLSTVVIGGRVVGLWKRTLEKNAVRVQVQPFADLDGEQKQAIQTAAQRYADFLELTLTMTVI